VCLLGFHHFNGKNKILRWLAAIFLLFIDITPLALLLETCMDILKVHTRPLKLHEKEIAISVFGKNIPLHLCGVDPASIPARKKITVAFTTLHTVNFDQSISDATFIHELVHIWQYRKYGSLYISESIWAQRWGGGYNYGGYEKLKLNLPLGLAAFNFEQQAEIVEDFYRLKNNLPLQWVAQQADLEMILDRYVHEVK